MTPFLILLGLTGLPGLATAASPWHHNNCAGNREAIVHLFEWKWTDVAKECERFLGPMGFCGVQISSPNEHAIVLSPRRPWWESYQPVSYKLTSRRGSEEELIDMVERCNRVNVRIYADIIINHMTGMGRSGIGTAGSSFNADAHSFPGVPYSFSDFNDCSSCSDCCCIDSWTDFARVRNCRLVGLIDLNHKVIHVQNMVSGFMNRLIEIGVAGFRIDAAKHMWPEDLEIIFKKLNNLNTKWFPSGSKPLIYMEVIDMNQGGEIQASSYKHLGLVTDFRYCVKIKDSQRNLGGIPYMYDAGWGMLHPDDAFVFVDNHDNQRGHGGGGSILTYKNPYEYKMAQAITLGWPYGQPRIMSSFHFSNSEAGPPMDENDNTLDVTINADGSCGNGWVCEHRWKPIAGMVSFSKATSGEQVKDFWSEGNQAVWRRGNKGFVAMTNQGGLRKSFYTGLPSGQYCNIIQGCPTKSGCEGQMVNVDSRGNAMIEINDSENPILAIHIEGKVGNGGCIDDGPAPTSDPQFSKKPTATPDIIHPPTDPPIGYKRTIIFINFKSKPGQDMFIRGGISHERRNGCTNDAVSSACTISITHNKLGSSTHYIKYLAWITNDHKLDWYGAEPGQGLYQGRRAEGSPCVWTSNRVTSSGFQKLNKWGDHYWMIDFNMNCDETEQGWFEVKAFVTNSYGWESDVNQKSCEGTAGGKKPYSSGNHFARCGYINIFHFNSNDCIINNF
ncbi:alpha-amylase-like isoform X1 [Tachypleus tridentatus]|uniref:alpha-amylase-like isoform X1 n=2 Tax=Tachypleus tridentatus TaxID=6853 RepID=UPI003FD0FA35